jgi:hypothetical protein
MKSLVVLSIAVLSVLAATSTAGAADYTCNGTLTGVTLKTVVVPNNGACTLVGSTVKGDVKVLANAYFEANATSIQGNVKGDQALTIYLHDGSTVGKSVKANKTAQVFLYDGSVHGSVQVQSYTGSGQVQVCGMTVDGNVKVQKTGTDILVGDVAAACGGNTIDGNVDVTNNVTDVELVVSDNTINGKLTVSKNTGLADKLVQLNTGGKKLMCLSNAAPFVGSPNSGFEDADGQCSF